MPHRPHDDGTPEQAGPSSAPPALEANTDNFFLNFGEPHCGHGVPSHFAERTSTSLSFPHCSQ